MSFGSSQAAPLGRPWSHVSAWMIKSLMRPVQVLVAAPSLLFIAALTAMLLRHPDVQFFEVDRVAFGLLVVGVVARAALLRERFVVFERATWPMIGLTVLALASVAGQSFDHEAWSLLASKFLVPFTLFHLAGVVFREEQDFREFEIFSLVVLAYLSFTAIAFLTGMHWLIFPRFILDESLGFHAERARGPLLQAVANGVSINVLWLVAVHSYGRTTVGRRKVLLVLASVPIAILATMTRAVWLAFAISALLVFFRREPRVLRRGWIWLVVVVGVGVPLLLNSGALAGDLGERLEERGPIDYREAVYSGGWEMFLQRPMLGWGFHQMPAELPRHVSGYHEKVLFPHNTYLELLVEHGVVGLLFYAWLMWELWQLGRGVMPADESEGFLNRNFHRLWPIVLGVYWVNATVVVMSYQFVNALVFTMAGMLAAQRRRAESCPEW
jgi:O-antigen ligase